jgi:hypothetical protein
MEILLIVAIIGGCLTVITLAWTTYLGWVTRQEDRGTDPLLESEQ